MHRSCARRPRLTGHDRDDQGVSSIVAAVLVFALVMTMLVLWSVETAPDWVEEREAQHQMHVSEAFGALRAGTDALSAADDAGPTTVPVRLAPRPLPVFQTDPAHGTLQVQGALSVTGDFRYVDPLDLVDPSKEPTIHAINGAPLGQPGLEVDSSVHSGVEELGMLTVSLATAGISANTLAYLRVDVQDVEGTTATIRLEHVGSGISDCSGAGIRLVLTAVATTTHVLACGASQALSGHTVDLLEPVYGFRTAVGRLQAPLQFTLTDGTSGGGPGAQATGKYGAVWTDTDGRTQIDNLGQEASYALDQSGAILEHVPNYQELTQQELRWEAGALVRVQGDGEAIIGAPSFSVEVVDDGLDQTGYVRWTLVQVTGDGSLTGDGSATVTVRHVDTTTVLLETKKATFTVTGGSGQAWRDYFEDNALLADLLTSSSVGGTGDTATLTLESTLNVVNWQIDLRLVTVQVQVG